MPDSLHRSRWAVTSRSLQLRRADRPFELARGRPGGGRAGKTTT